MKKVLIFAALGEAVTGLILVAAGRHYSFAGLWHNGRSRECGTCDINHVRC
jgi:hypothetical protein